MSSNQKPVLLYFHPGMASFIRKDLAIIEQEWRIILFEFRQDQKHLVLLDFLRQFIFLFQHIWVSKRIVCQFGGYHSLLPAVFGRIFRIPVWMILGGYDCYSFPEIKYGAFHKKWFGKIVGYSYQLADLLSPVHESMVDHPYSYYPSGYPSQGFQFFLPQLKTKIETIHNGYEPDKFRDLHKSRIPNSFLTVARDTAGSTYFRKGIDLILEAAPHFPHFQFTIIGKNKDQEISLPSNIRFLPPVPYEELQQIYNDHEFYLQLSIAEGFPNALSEAMLCGCIPIGSDVFGIPDLIGDTGLILKHRDIQELITLFSGLDGLDKKGLSENARKRVSEKFNLEMREQKMLQVLRDL
jgi:glycosyltransferase involved in cell wall biosynthesis